MTLNHLINILALTTLSGTLTACSLFGSQPATSSTRYEVVKGRQQQLNFKLASGIYRCEFGQKVEVQRDARNANLIEIDWQRSHYTLQRYDSTSGLPRFEDRKNGLLWIDLPWKSVLMDTSSGRPLANECKAMTS